MSSSCEDIKALFKNCLMRSDCVQKDGRLPSDCLQNHFDELPDDCKALRTAVFNCKRGMLDMRRRFRGNSAGYVPPSSHTENAVPP